MQVRRVHPFDRQIYVFVLAGSPFCPGYCSPQKLKSCGCPGAAEIRVLGAARFAEYINAVSPCSKPKEIVSSETTCAQINKK